ncbi:sensor histidine kinase [Glycomyces buryatensis]|uniref:histidine kinase n=1 Tax=Glycomyces buryatensis TaxID=2570927 RepID=A0A4S8QDN3_9ACTN|nr:histidine kinase [Glycomyces buryatensis]THV41751.1 two-component sensor histidine kinase [Glycomyces buryatensis]
MNSPLGRVRRGDLIAAVLLFAIGAVLIGLGSFEPYQEVPLAVRFVPLGLVCLGVVIRRSAPGWCLALGTVGFGAEVFIGFSLVTVCVYTDNIYSYVRYGPRERTRLLFAAASMLVLGAAVWIGVESRDAGGTLSTAAIAAIILLSPIGTGVIVRQAHDRAELEAERAQQAASLADVRRREAVLRERTLMARELHDTVANYLSAIALQSTGLQSRRDLDAETVRRSVAAIRQSSVEGLAELRRIIGLLRAADSEEELASYRLDQVPQLVERMRRVGLKVDFATSGEFADLPGEVETAAFRVVQEALTNALKYGSDASVEIACAPGRLTVAVENAVDTAAVPFPSGGAGLVGMTERVRLLGGTVRAGPDGRRWRVRAEIPTGDPVAVGRTATPPPTEPE